MITSHAAISGFGREVEIVIAEVDTDNNTTAVALPVTLIMQTKQEAYRSEPTLTLRTISPPWRILSNGGRAFLPRRNSVKRNSS